MKGIHKKAKATCEKRLTCRMADVLTQAILTEILLQTKPVLLYD